MKTYSDGAARGNPGPAGIGVLLTKDSGLLIESYYGRLRNCTNNQSEYHAVIKALRMAEQNGAKEVIHHSDSELVIKQLTGEYKVKNVELKKLFLTVKSLEKHFKKIKYKHLRRTHPKIVIVDVLANKALGPK